MNDAPTLTALSDQTVQANGGVVNVPLAGISPGPLNESGQTPLTVMATSNNPAVVPNPSVGYTSPATTGSISFTPLAGGTAMVTVTVTDSGSNVSPNVNFFTRTFDVTVYGPGDYDHNGSVQQADYTFWRAHFGDTSGAGLAADGNGNVVVDAADYIVWRKSSNAGSGSAAAAESAISATTPPAVAVAPTVASVPTVAAGASSLTSPELGASSELPPSLSANGLAPAAVDQAVTALALDIWQPAVTSRRLSDRRALASLRNSPIQDSAAHDLLLTLLFSPLLNDERTFAMNEAAPLDVSFDEPELLASLTLNEEGPTAWCSYDGLN